MKRVGQSPPDTQVVRCRGCKKEMAEFATLWHCQTAECERYSMGVCGECTVMRLTPVRPPVRSSEIQPPWWKSPWSTFAGVTVVLLLFLVWAAWKGYPGGRSMYVWGALAFTIVAYEEYLRRFSGNTRWLGAHTAAADDLRARWSFPRRCCAKCQEELPAGRR
jgi:hypothetical protein